jgi:uncharacterized short protein YbdD (DUF466 family)
MALIRRAIKTIWQFLREACGENDYARYCEAAARRGDRPLSQEAFYLSKLNKKYSRPNRCC